jgi:hypothetical protein
MDDLNVARLMTYIEARADLVIAATEAHQEAEQTFCYARSCRGFFAELSGEGPVAPPDFGFRAAGLPDSVKKAVDLRTKMLGAWNVLSEQQKAALRPPPMESNE